MATVRFLMSLGCSQCDYAAGVSFAIAIGVYEPLHQPCEPCSVSPPCHHVADNWAILHGMVLCVSSFSVLYQEIMP